MVENSTVGVAYSYYTVYNIDDIALCASRTEFDTEAGYGNCIRCYGYGHIRGADRPSLSFEFVGPRCIGGTACRQCC